MTTWGRIPGTLPISSAVGLKGGARTPTPSIVVNFRSETTGCDQPLFCSATVTDGRRCRARATTAASAGPTRRIHGGDRPGVQGRLRQRGAGQQCRHRADAGAGIGVTLAPVGKLRGRVVSEALVGGAPVTVSARTSFAARRRRSAHDRQSAIRRVDALLRRGGLCRTDGGRGCRSRNRERRAAVRRRCRRMRLSRTAALSTVATSPPSQHERGRLTPPSKTPRAAR